MRTLLSSIWLFLLLMLASGSWIQASPCLHGTEALSTPPAQSPKEIPAAARQTLAYVRTHHAAPPGHVGGRRFGNYEKRLPQQTPSGTRVFYQEWDIYPRQKRRSRGPERLVTGSDGRAWYTPDHYQSFKEIQ